MTQTLCFGLWENFSHCISNLQFNSFSTKSAMKISQITNNYDAFISIAAQILWKLYFYMRHSRNVRKCMSTQDKTLTPQTLCHKMTKILFAQCTQVAFYHIWPWIFWIIPHNGTEAANLVPTVVDPFLVTKHFKAHPSRIMPERTPTPNFASGWAFQATSG